MKTGQLTSIPGYVPVQETARYKQELAEYRNLKAYYPVNAVLMGGVALATYFVVRKAVGGHHALVRWLVSAGAIGCGAFAIFAVYFVVMLAFYDTPGKKPPNSATPWVGDYERDMALLVARQLLGHEPANAWHNQLTDYTHLVASPEILVITFDDIYIMVLPADVVQVRKVMEPDLAAKAAGAKRGYSVYKDLDPEAEILSVIRNEPAHHEWGTVVLGPFEIVLRTPRPRAIWFERASLFIERKDERDPINNGLENDAFLRHLTEVLHPGVE